MKKEIFDSLAKLSPEHVAGSSIPKMTPSVEISGELAFCLDTLMNTVGERMNLSPTSVLEKILTNGIETWVDQLSAHTRKSIGLIGAATITSLNDSKDWDDDDDPDPARAQQAAYAQLTESYGYTPLTAHTMAKPKNGSSRGDQRNGTNGGRKTAKSKSPHAIGKKQAAKKHNSRRRKFAQNKMTAQPQ